MDFFWRLSAPFTISQMKFCYLALVTLLHSCQREQFFPFLFALFPPLPCLVGQRLRQSVAFLIRNKILIAAIDVLLSRDR